MNQSLERVPHHLFWDGVHGYLPGPGFQAFADDFPVGTKLIVTARIELPTPEKPPRMVDRDCPKCHAPQVELEVIDSSCGGYSDDKYTCPKCGHIWWIDGADA